MEKLLKFHVLADKCPRKGKKVYCEKCKYNNGWDNNMKTYCQFHDKNWLI